MTFLSPLTLIGLLLVALPLAIHLLVRRRARRLDFPSLRFLRETPSFKLHPRRIRQPLLLALRAAAIILLVLGLARPLMTFLKGKAAPVRFILLDSSLSMKASGRAEAAREQARAIINKLADGERAAIIAFPSESTLPGELTADRNKLFQAIERYQPGGGTTNYGAAFAQIKSQLQREADATGEIDVISDFQQAGLENETSVTLPISRTSLRIVSYPVGSQIERNAFSVDESVGKTEQGVALSSTEIVSERDGRSATRRRWSIDGHEGVAPGIEWRTQTNGQITGRLSTLESDDFDADDERYFAFAPPREGRVLLIEDEGSAGAYLRAALETAGGENVSKITLDTRGSLPETTMELSPYTLVVLSLHGPPRQNEVDLLTEYIRAGGALWLFLARDLDTESWTSLAQSDKGRDLPFESLTRVSARTVIASDSNAPQFRMLDESALAGLRAVRVNAGYALNPRRSALTLMRWSDGTPAFVSSRIGNGTILLLSTSPERESSEFGTSPSFPALAASIVKEAADQREPLSLVCGEAIRLDGRPDLDVKITDIGGRVLDVRQRDLISRPLTYFTQPGIYKLEFAGREKFVACNSPAAESERALATEDYLGRLFSADDSQRTNTAISNNWRDAEERSGSMWRYFFIAAFLLMIAELSLAMHRPGISGPE